MEKLQNAIRWMSSEPAAAACVAAELQRRRCACSQNVFTR